MSIILDPPQSIVEDPPKVTKLGAMEAKAVDIEYQAGSKGGFVLVRLGKTTPFDADTTRWWVYADPTSPPTTTRGGHAPHAEYAGLGVSYSVLIPIPPNWYWKASGAISNLWYIPLL